MIPPTLLSRARASLLSLSNVTSDPDPSARGHEAGATTRSVQSKVIVLFLLWRYILYLCHFSTGYFACWGGEHTENTNEVFNDVSRGQLMYQSPQLSDNGAARKKRQTPNRLSSLPL